MSKTSFSAVALAVALLGLGGAKAQTLPPASSQPEQIQIVELHTEQDTAAVLDARLAALKTVIGMTAEQEILWSPLHAALRQAARNAAERRTQRERAAQPQDFVDILVRTADAEAARAADIRTVGSALKPLVASLSEAQRRRIPPFLGMREGRYGQPQPLAELWLFEDES